MLPRMFYHYSMSVLDFTFLLLKLGNSAIVQHVSLCSVAVILCSSIVGSDLKVSEDYVCGH